MKSWRNVAVIAAATLTTGLGAAVVAPAPAAHAAGVCTVYADKPHVSTHNPGRMNGVGSVRCSYNPIGDIQLEVRIQKRTWYGYWYTVPTSRTVLNHTSYYVRHSRSKECVDGTYKTQSRAYAAGPNGEAPRWSLWATSFIGSVDCPSGGGGSGSW